VGGRRVVYLGGLAYWFVLTPIHLLVFRGMLRGIARAALRPASSREVLAGGR